MDPRDEPEGDKLKDGALGEVILFDVMTDGFYPLEDLPLIFMTWAFGSVMWVFSARLAPFFSLSWLKLRDPSAKGGAWHDANEHLWKDPRADEKKLRRGLMIGMVLVTLAIAFFKMQEYLKVRDLRGSYQSGGYSEVTGSVEEFQPANACVTNRRVQRSRSRPNDDTSPNESFQIGDFEFVYSDQLITGGFHQSSACGGPIRDGLNLRIWHVDGIIIRIENLGNLPSDDSS